MKPFFNKMVRVGGAIATALTRFRESVFHSKLENARRASGRFETLKRQEMEAERIDRLRNPSDYQGR